MIWLLRLILVLLAFPALAEDAPVVSRLDLAQSALVAEGRDRGRPRSMDLTLALSQPTPYRVYFLDGPPRLVVDFRQVDFTGTDPAALTGRDLVPAIRWGRFRQGWSRMVVELPGPYALSFTAQQQTPLGALLRLRIDPVKPEAFVTRGNSLSALWDLPQPADIAAPPQPRGDRALRVAIDPGHGGHDPGAQVGAISEAAVILGFARELTEALNRAGIEVVPTRTDDSFVPLERRMTLARAGAADVFISLHADALPEGQAAGLSIYTWDPSADDRALRQLALRHDRDDLLAGVDLQGTDDEVAGVLMDLARSETQPRSESFAKFVVSELNGTAISMHPRPVRGAAFSVLKSPDIPSVLIELGFLTDPGDRANLFDPDWRARTAAAISSAVAKWAKDDASRQQLSFQ